MKAAIFDKNIRGDDVEFYAAVREWETIILHGDFTGYHAHFKEIQSFFSDRLTEASKASSDLIAKITSHYLKPSE